MGDKLPLDDDIAVLPTSRVEIQIIYTTGTSTVRRRIWHSMQEVIRNNPLVAGMELWNLQELLYNLTQHELVSPHRVVEEDELAGLKKRYGRDVVDRCPIVYDSDPMMRFFGFKAGSLIRIDRFRPRTQATQPYYRLLMNAIDDEPEPESDDDADAPSSKPAATE